MLGSSMAAAIADTMTLPFDMARVRLQIQKRSLQGAQGGTLQYSGMFDCVRKARSQSATSLPRPCSRIMCAVQIQKTEGASGLFKGLAPALARTISYTSITMILFEPLRDFLSGDAEPTFGVRLLAGGTAGGVGIGLMNPTEVIKVKIQGHSAARLSMASVAKQVYKNDGILGFWSGVKPNVIRTFLVNAAELGTYDQAKSIYSDLGLPDGFLNHLAASATAGLASATVATPADVLKTRMMNNAGSTQQYRAGVFSALYSIATEEGMRGLHGGFVPIFWRKLFYCTIFFVSYEKLRVLLQ